MVTLILLGVGNPKISIELDFPFPCLYCLAEEDIPGGLHGALADHCLGQFWKTFDGHRGSYRQYWISNFL
jgi:hypothetical protein